MGGKQDIGFIAQDLQKVLPELVSDGSVEGQLAVNYDHISAVNTAAIQELNVKLEQENAELRKRIEALENAMKKLGVIIEK